LPLGGLDHGHKGSALALLVEALTQGLSGYGRAEEPKEWGGSVCVLAMSPRAFSGAEGFLRETSWTVAACRSSPSLPGREPVRIPGELGLARKKEALTAGLALHPAAQISLDRLSLEFRLALTPA
jgi:L-lactate dehydrogenase